MQNRNPYLCKKGFYISEQIWGYCGEDYILLDTVDKAGPFKTLDRAKEVLNTKYLRHTSFTGWPPISKDHLYCIRGPEFQPESRISGLTSPRTIWYY